MRARNISNVGWFIPNIIAQKSPVSPLRDVIISNRPSLGVDSSPIKIEFFIDKPLESTTPEVDREAIIDTFLQQSELRIVANSDGEDIEVETSLEFDSEDDLVSEELANIYLSQGLNDMAIDIYTQLSLLNSEKSSYFAELIENIKQK